MSQIVCGSHVSQLQVREQSDKLWDLMRVQVGTTSWERSFVKVRLLEHWCQAIVYHDVGLWEDLSVLPTHNN